MNDGRVTSSMVDRSSKVSSQLVADNRRPAGQGGHRLGQAVGPAGCRAAPINPNACPEERNSEKKKRARERETEMLKSTLKQREGR